MTENERILEDILSDARLLIARCQVELDSLEPKLLQDGYLTQLVKLNSLGDSCLVKASQLKDLSQNEIFEELKSMAAKLYEKGVRVHEAYENSREDLHAQITKLGEQLLQKHIVVSALG